MLGSNVCKLLDSTKAKRKAPAELSRGFSEQLLSFRSVKLYVSLQPEIRPRQNKYLKGLQIFDR